MGADEAVKLTQFGIDWLRATRRSGRAGAGAGVEGSPYTAPEQALNGEATPQSDVYAVGAILYEALLGRPPAVALSTRRRVSVTSLRKIRPEVTRALDNIVLRALESDPARRYRDMTDFFNDLWGEVNPFSGPTPAPTGAVRRMTSTAGWSRSIAVGIVLLVGGGVALLSWLLIGGSPAPDIVPRAAAPRPEPTVMSASAVAPAERARVRRAAPCPAAGDRGPVASRASRGREPRPPRERPVVQRRRPRPTAPRPVGPGAARTGRRGAAAVASPRPYPVARPRSAWSRRRPREPRRAPLRRPPARAATTGAPSSTGS